MISYKSYIVGKKARIDPKGSKFQVLVIFNGANIEDCERAIKSVNIGNMQIRPNNLIKAAKNKNKSDFIKFVNGSGDQDFIYLNDGDLIAVAQREIYVFSRDYVRAFFDVDWKNNIIRLHNPEDAEE